MSRKHTPTPYEVHSKFVGPLVLKSGNTEIAHVAADSFALCQANAEFIARACNTHDELVAALLDLVNCIDETFARATENALKALNKARGE